MKIKVGILGLIGLLFSAAPSAAQWTGCGFGVGAGMMFGEAMPPGGFGPSLPIGFGAQGEKAGVLVNCDYRMQAFVVGGEATYDWYFGDIKTLGIQNEFALLGRLGVLTSPVNLLYATAGWGSMDFSSTPGPDKKINSWKIGLGDEFRIPNSPMYLDLRVLYSRFDETDIGPGFKGARVDSLDGTVRVKFKFGPGMFTGSKIIDLDPEPVIAHDPKLMAPSKK